MFFIPIVTDFAVTGLVPKFPTLIMCVFVMLAAIQSFFSGVILQTICQKNYQDFEMELLRCNNKAENNQRERGN